MPSVAPPGPEPQKPEPNWNVKYGYGTPEYDKNEILAQKWNPWYQQYEQYIVNQVSGGADLERDLGITKDDPETRPMWYKFHGMGLNNFGENAQQRLQSEQANRFQSWIKNNQDFSKMPNGLYMEKSSPGGSQWNGQVFFYNEMGDYVDPQGNRIGGNYVNQDPHPELQKGWKGYDGKGLGVGGQGLAPYLNGAYGGQGGAGGYGGADMFSSLAGNPAFNAQMQSGADINSELAKQARLDTLTQAFNFNRAGQEYAQAIPLENYYKDVLGSILGVNFENPQFDLSSYINKGMQGVGQGQGTTGSYGSGGYGPPAVGYDQNGNPTQQMPPDMNDQPPGTPPGDEPPPGPPGPFPQDPNSSPYGNESLAGLPGFRSYQPIEGQGAPPSGPNAPSLEGGPSYQGMSTMSASGAGTSPTQVGALNNYPIRSPFTQLPPGGSVYGPTPPGDYSGLPPTGPPGRLPPEGPYKTGAPPDIPMNMQQSGDLVRGLMANGQPIRGVPTGQGGAGTYSYGTSSPFPEQIPFPTIEGKGYSTATNAYDPSNPKTWAFLAQPAAGIAGDLDSAIKRYKAEAPVGGETNANIADLIRGAYGNVAGLRQGLVSQALSGVSGLAGAKKGFNPGGYSGAAGDVLNSMTSMYGANKGLEGTKYASDASLKASQDASNKGFWGNVFGTIGNLASKFAKTGTMAAGGM